MRAFNTALIFNESVFYIFVFLYCQNQTSFIAFLCYIILSSGVLLAHKADDRIPPYPSCLVV